MTQECSRLTVLILTYKSLDDDSDEIFSTVAFLEIFTLRRRVFQWLEAPAAD